MCDNIKVVRTKVKVSETEYFYMPQLVSCGKCYDCMMTARAQFCVRCAAELKDSVCAFFVTLTYSDYNLPFWNFSRVERRNALDYAKLHPHEFGVYSKFVLEPRHCSHFFKSMQKQIKLYSESLLFRMVVNGEYGTWTQRPHLHALIYSPIYFTISDFSLLLSRCWKYGGINVKPVSPANINYMGKHCMKEDKGSILQNRVSPIFQRRSSYHKGIGRSLSKDVCVVANYNNDKNFISYGRYKVLMPRYIKRQFRPDGYSSGELGKMQFESYNSLLGRLFAEFGFTEYDALFSMYGGDFDFSLVDQETKLYLVSEFYRNLTSVRNKNKLSHYYKQKFVRHKLKLKKDGFINNV